VSEGLRRVEARPLGHPAREEWVAEEAPVALVLNGVSQAVMLATPLDLEDFALGFALGEGWLLDAAELLDLEIESAAVPGASGGQAEGMTLELRTTGAAAARAAQRRRTLAGRTGCGLCGIESLAQWPRPARRPLPATALTPAALDAALAGLQAGQRLNSLCGGLHAAAWCSLDGELLMLREDVGRHNALDKLVGAVVRAGLDRAQGFVLLSSRASIELVHKTVTLGAGALATASAPTAQAIRAAQTHGLALWAFVRAGRGTRYA
jgi:formate dehydrogenase accessory protein FdhD